MFSIARFPLLRLCFYPYHFSFLSFSSLAEQYLHKGFWCSDLVLSTETMNQEILTTFWSY
jgi:hypothetical protein